MNDFRNVIAGRRDAKRQPESDFSWLAQGAADGSVPDYQLSAWLMAAYLNPPDLDETAELTLAMARSGTQLDLSSLSGHHLDKHSTGGVGDKTTLVLLPLLASLNVYIVKMSGAGLGITGGTVDKLKSIPGFNVALSPEQMIAQAAKIRVALSGQTPDLAPADKRLYELRDTTATTESIPLITSSILSKKIAAGAKNVMIDVKCGSGAFMTEYEGAKQLARMLEAVGTRCGLRVKAELSDMSQPLGSAIGNALEVEEAFQVLSNAKLTAPTLRFRELCVNLAAEALVFCGVTTNLKDAQWQVETSLAAGAAIDSAIEWVSEQGGPGSLDEILKSLPVATVKREVHATHSGWVQKIDARAIGVGVIDLGGGRRTKTDEIDPSVGFTLDVSIGAEVKAGDRLLTIHAQDESSAKSVEASLIGQVVVSSEPVNPTPLFLDR